MVRRLSEAGLLEDPALRTAFETVPRHLFVPATFAGAAYGDHALPIGLGQTATQPANVARAASLLALKEGSRALEVGTGSGYQTAILARVCRHVFSVERIAELSATAQRTLASLGIRNVTLHVFDGTYGWREHAPYDGIVVSAAAPEVPEPLLAQLTPTGRLVVPVGPPEAQRLLLVKRLPNGRTRTEDAGEVAFVPLVGKFGFAGGPRAGAKG